MSSKFTKQQKRRKYAEAGTIFPASFVAKIEALQHSEGSPSALHVVAGALYALATSHNTYGELGDLRPTTEVFVRSVEQEQLEAEHFATAAGLWIELLFLEGSGPLHRGVLSAFKRLKSKHHDVIGELLAARIHKALEEYQQLKETGALQHTRKIILGPTLSSLTWLSPLWQTWTRPVCAEAVACLADCASAVITAVESGVRLAPSLSEDLTDAVSTLYYMITHHGQHLATGCGEAGRHAVASVGMTMLQALQGSHLVRETMSSGMVTLWAAACLPNVPAPLLAAEFAEGLFLIKSDTQATASQGTDTTPARIYAAQHVPTNQQDVAGHAKFHDSTAAHGACAKDTLVVQPAILDTPLASALLSRGTSLIIELSKLSDAGRICAVKGLVTGLPSAALSAMYYLVAISAPGAAATHTESRTPSQPPTPAAAVPGSETAVPASAVATVAQPAAAVVEGMLQRQPWSLLIDGALTYASRAVSSASDAHSKFYASTVLNVCFQKLQEEWNASPTSNTPGAAPASSDCPSAASNLSSACQPANRCDSHNSALVLHDGWHAARVATHHRDTLLWLLWTDMEGPLPQTVRQIQEAFERLLHLLAAQAKHVSVQAQEELQQWMQGVARMLLALDYRQRRRYMPLASLVPHVGALYLLAQQPALVAHTLAAMQDDMLASAAASFLKVLLSKLQQECIEQQINVSTMTVYVSDPAMDAWYKYWLQPLLQALYSASDKLRAYVSIHALPAILELDPRCSLTILRAILGDTTPETVPGSSRIAAVVAVLKASRNMGLLWNLDDLSAVSPDMEQVLLTAISHASDSIRADVLELACVHERLIEPPGKLDLQLVQRWLQLGCRNTGVGTRNKCIVLVTKMMQRVKTSSAGLVHRYNIRARGMKVFKHNEIRAKAAHQGVLGSDSTTTEAAEMNDAALMAQEKEAALRLQEFVQWCTRYLVACLYPGAPYERKYFALELLGAVVDSFGNGTVTSRGVKPDQDKSRPGPAPTKNTSGVEGGACDGTQGVAPAAAHTGQPPETATTGAQLELQMYCPQLLSSSTIAWLLGAAVDSWDLLRQGATSLLNKLPHPLPGLATPVQLQPLLQWCCSLLGSARLRESDAGARMLQLVVRKYVIEHGWQLALHPDLCAILPNDTAQDKQLAQHSTENPRFQQASGAVDEELHNAGHVLRFLGSVTDLIQHQLEAASEDLLSACRKSLVHGSLLSLRYAAEVIRWRTLAADPTAAPLLRQWLRDRLLPLLVQATNVALPPLQRPQDQNLTVEDVVILDGDGAENGEDGDDGDDGLGPEAQIINSACWSTVKEVCLLIGTLAQMLPMPEDAAATDVVAVAAACPTDAGVSTRPISTTNSSTPAAAVAKANSQVSEVWDVSDIATLGGLLSDMLCEVKHNGTVEKAAMALSQLSQPLLRSTNPGLHALPGQWLEQFLTRICRPGQTNDDIVRRSAGLPFGLVALFTAEPANMPKVLLPRAMSAVMAIASAGIPSSSCKDNGTGSIGSSNRKAGDLTANVASTTSDLSAGSELPLGITAAGDCSYSQAWASRAVEKWHWVHGFNTLRHAFQDASLSVDTSGFCADGAQACILALASPHWEVRNSASLCFVALMTRMIGFKNNADWKACKKTTSAADFFHRFPQLHGFLLSQLGEALEQLRQRGPAGAMHPSLYPILIILSRLKPSPLGPASNPWVGTSTTDPLSPAPFIPLVQAVATSAASLAVRRLAALALSPLLPEEGLANTMLQLVQPLAAANNQVQREGSSGQQGSDFMSSQITQQGAVHQVQQEHHWTTGIATLDAGDSGNTCTTATPSFTVASLPPLPMNKMHGCLLQLLSLLQNNMSAGGSSGLLLHLLKLLEAAASTCSFPPATALQARLSSCCAVTSVYVQTVAAALSWLQACSVLQLQASTAESSGVQTFASKSSTSVDQQQANTALAHENDGHGSPLHTQPACTAPADFLESLEIGCASIIAGTAAISTTQSVVLLLQPHSDFPDVMRSDMHKHVVGLWLGPVLVSQVLHLPGTQIPSAFATTLRDRLGICLASDSYDIRAAAMKHAVSVLSVLSSILATSTSAGTSCPTAATPAAAKHPAHDRPVVLLAANHSMTRWLINQLIRMVWKQLNDESVHKVRRRLLQALRLLLTLNVNSLALSNTDCSTGSGSLHDEGAAAIPLQNMLQLLMSAHDLDSRCEALRCLGYGVRTEVERIMTSAAIRTDIDTSPCPHASVTSQSASSVVSESAQTASLSGDSSAHNAVPAIASFAREAWDASHPNQAEDLREAAVQALAASGLLVALPVNIPELTAAAMLAWRSILQLTEEEIPELRLQATATAQQAISTLQSSVAAASDSAAAGPGAFVSSPCTMPDQASSGRGISNTPAACALSSAEANTGHVLQDNCSSICSAVMINSHSIDPAVNAGHSNPTTVASDNISNGILSASPLQVEAVQAGVLHVLGTCMWKQLGAASIDLLCRLVWDVQEPVPETLKQDLGAGRKLFDKELDNPHEEPCWLAQLAAKQLRHITDEIASSSASEGALFVSGVCDTLQDWCSAASTQLAAALSKLSVAQSASSSAASSNNAWMGGNWNHPDVWPYLYRLLLVFWAVNPMAVSGDSAQGIKEAMSDFARVLPATGLDECLEQLLIHLQLSWSGKRDPQASKEEQNAVLFLVTDQLKL